MLNRMKGGFHTSHVYTGATYCVCVGGGGYCSLCAPPSPCTSKAEVKENSRQTEPSASARTAISATLWTTSVGFLQYIIVMSRDTSDMQGIAPPCRVAHEVVVLHTCTMPHVCAAKRTCAPCARVCRVVWRRLHLCPARARQTLPQYPPCNRLSAHMMQHTAPVKSALHRWNCQ